MKKPTVLITGASSGIGMETALLLHQSGYKVYACARRLKNMQHLELLGISTMFMDVTRDEAMVSCVERIIQESGAIDILINNAGFALCGAIEEIPMAEGRYQFEVNFMGLVRLTQLVIPYMRVAKSGRIINISSIAGIYGESFGGWYHASKHAVEGLSGSLWRELAPYGIHVIVIQPGCIKTEWENTGIHNLYKNYGNPYYTLHKNERGRILSKLYDEKMASKPLVIAKVILTALQQQHPRIRYVAGNGARNVSFLKKYLSDKMFFKAMDFAVRLLTR